MISKSAKQDHGKDERPRVIIKKVKKHHGGHHGGAWKVAYADFVTAMMALFIVLWILGASDKKFKAGIAHYFREPGVFSGSRGIITNGGQDALGSGIIQSPSLEVLESYIKQQLAGSKELMKLKDQIPITLTAEGLLIEMIDKDKGAFFEVSSAKIKPVMRKVLEVIVQQVEKTPHRLTIGGHTDARPYHDESFYSNWELSSARALNTRRALEEIGLAPTRVEEVVGYADRKLRDAADPLSAENRRISILIKTREKNDQEPST
jgi:chemotaxis protein MotB